MDGRSEQRLGSKNFFENQCRLLGEQLSIAEKIILNRGKGPADVIWPQSALKDLRRLLEVGKTLTDGCRSEPCQKAYLRQGERTQAFANTLREIIWCMSLVFSHNSKPLKSSPGIPNSVALNGESIPEASLGAREQYMLDKAALDDQKELLTAVDMCIENHQVCSVLECGVDRSVGDPLICVAAQILKRRNNARNAGVEVPPAQADHTSVLWITQQEFLKNGRRLGSGGFGTVYEMTWLGDKYAKKEFDMHNTQILEDEANALAKLNHPHIVKPLAYSVAGSDCFLLMNLMPHDLRAYINERLRKNINPPFSILAATDLMLQIAEAYRYINSQGMVHRDLKPQNILVQPVDAPELAEEGFVIAKLTDFGLAKSKHGVTTYSHQTRNQGISPHQNVKRSELYEKLKDPDFRPKLDPARCPKRLASLIHRCWDFNPERRPDFSEISSTPRYLKGLFLTEITPEVIEVSMTLRHIKGLRMTAF